MELLLTTKVHCEFFVSDNRVKDKHCMCYIRQIVFFLSKSKIKIKLTLFLTHSEIDRVDIDVVWFRRDFHLWDKTKYKKKFRKKLILSVKMITLMILLKINR